MKDLLYFLLAAYTMPLLAQDRLPLFNDENEAKQVISRTLDQLPRLLAEDPTGITAQQFLRKDGIPNWIQHYFYMGGLTPLHKYYPERQVRVEEIERTLAPYERMLTDLTFLTKHINGESEVAFQFLTYAPATPTLKSALVELRSDLLQSARKSYPNTGLIMDVYGMIFSHQMDDVDFRKKTIDFILEHRDVRSVKSDIASALYVACMRAAIPEMKMFI